LDLLQDFPEFPPTGILKKGVFDLIIRCLVVDLKTSVMAAFNVQAPRIDMLSPPSRID